MIVRNEAHIVHEVLDAVAPYISSWVIVDTGSNDGTQDLIRNHMARLGIPGELYERPWRNFGHNRTEALSLAQGHGDYIWVMDADDTVVGTPDFTRLSADIYQLRIENRRTRTTSTGARSCSATGCACATRVSSTSTPRGTTLTSLCASRASTTSNLVASVPATWIRRSMRATAICCWPRSNATPRMRGRSSTWPRATSIWAISSTPASGMRGGPRWAAGTRRSTTRCTGSRSRCRYSVSRGPMFRTPTCGPGSFDRPAPSRCMPIAYQYRVDRRYRLGYLFAKRAAEIPFPEQDALFVRADIYAWRAIDEQAVCASWIDKHCRGVHAVPAPAGPTRPPRRRSAKDCGQPRPLCADDDRSGIVIPRRAGAAPASPGPVRPRWSSACSPARIGPAPSTR